MNGCKHKYDHISYNMKLAGNIVGYNKDQLEFKQSPRNKNHKSNLRFIQFD